MENAVKYTSFDVEMNSTIKSNPPMRFLKYEHHHITEEEIETKQKAAEERRKVQQKISLLSLIHVFKIYFLEEGIINKPNIL